MLTLQECDCADEWPSVKFCPIDDGAFAVVSRLGRYNGALGGGQW
jgi:hypothetical protein